MKHNYKELLVWQQSRLLVKQIYLLTKDYPKDELFGLISQMRRASISIPSNIAEGFGRGTNAQIKHFLNISHGSLFELETQLFLSLDLGFLTENQFNELQTKISSLSKMIEGLNNKF